MTYRLTICTILFFFKITTLNAAVVDFESGIGAGANLSNLLSSSNFNYAGLFWEQGLPGGGSRGRTGYWTIPSSVNNYPIGKQNVVNAWGALFLGISFGSTVNVEGAYFSEQGNAGLSTDGIRVHGYLNGNKVGNTDWFNDIDKTNSWFSMNLLNVDRIVIEAQEVANGAGIYGMDNLTYSENISVVPIPSSILFLGCAVFSLIVCSRTKIVD